MLMQLLVGPHLKTITLSQTTQVPASSDLASKGQHEQDSDIYYPNLLLQIQGFILYSLWKS